MTFTHEQIRDINRRIAKRTGGWIGGISAALLFLLVILIANGFGAGDLVNPPQNALWGYRFAALIAIALSAWTGRIAGPYLLPTSGFDQVLAIGIPAGYVLGLIFVTLIVMVDNDFVQNLWILVPLGGLLISLPVAIISIPWGIATAAFLRFALKPYNKT